MPENPNHPSARVMLEQTANVYLAYGADLTMEALVFLGNVKMKLDHNMAVTPDDMHKLKKLWNHFVKPLREKGAR